MCVVSMVMDHYYNKWQPQVWPATTGQPATITIITNPVTQAEIDEFRLLLERAREYDRKMNQPECELEEKKAKLKKLAEELGVDISFL